MLESSKKILALACVVAISVSALLAVFLTLDLITNTELRQILSRVLLVVGVITAALLGIVAVLRTGSKK